MPHTAKTQILQILLQYINLIRCFPWKRDIITAKMPICRGGAIDWPAQIQHLDNSCRTQIKILTDHFHQLLICNFPRPEGIHHNGCGLRHTNGICQLNLTFLCQPCRHNILRYITCRIGSASVHLCTVLAGESAAAGHIRHRYPQ